MISDKKYFFYTTALCLFLYFILITIFSFSIYIHAQNNTTASSPVLTVPSPINNQKISFDGSVNIDQWTKAQQISFNKSNGLDIGKIYLQYDLKDNALEGAFVIPNPTSNNDARLHLLLHAAKAIDNNNKSSYNLNSNNDHKIDLSKNLQQARYFIGNGPNGWKVENTSMQGNNNITIPLNEPFNKINIVTSSNAEKWTGEFKIYFIHQPRQLLPLPINRLAIVQENYISGKYINSSIPPNVSSINPSTWSAISLSSKNMITPTITENTSSPTSINKSENQTSLSTSAVPPLSPKTINNYPNNTIAPNITSNSPITKTTPNTDSSSSITSTTSKPPSNSPQNPLLEPTVLAALITTIGVIIVGIITAKSKSKST